MAPFPLGSYVFPVFQLYHQTLKSKLKLLLEEIHLFKSKIDVLRDLYELSFFLKKNSLKYDGYCGVQTTPNNIVISGF